MESLNQLPKIKALYANLRNWVISPGDNLRSLVSAEVTLAIKLVMASEVLSWELPMSFMVAPSMIWEMKSNFISFIGDACNVRMCEASGCESNRESQMAIGRFRELFGKVFKENKGLQVLSSLPKRSNVCSTQGMIQTKHWSERLPRLLPIDHQQVSWGNARQSQRSGIERKDSENETTTS